MKVLPQLLLALVASVVLAAPAAAQGTAVELKVGDQAPDLIIIGQRGWEASEAIAMLDEPGPLQGHVHELGRCTDKEMGDLLTGARAMLMPSFVEGFGLPIVEALQLGVPVIASDLPVFRELAGGILTYLDPGDRQHDVAPDDHALTDHPVQQVDQRDVLGGQRELAHAGSRPCASAPTEKLYAGHGPVSSTWIPAWRHGPPACSSSTARNTSS